MKIMATAIAGFMLISTALPAVRAQDRDLVEKVQKFYETSARYVEEKNLEASLSELSEDFQMIFTGLEPQTVRDSLEKLFKEYDEFWSEHLIFDITRTNGYIKVLSSNLLKARSSGGDWKTVADVSELNYLIEKNGSFKIFRSAEIDKDRLKDIEGQTYKDKETGISFTVPEKWSIIPSKHIMKGFVLALAPDMTSVASFGYLNLPIPITAQKALEGDEMLTEKMSQKGTYKLIHSGPISAFGYEGFESKTEFFIPNNQQRRRRRIYVNAGGALYVLIFDAIPTARWNAVKDGFQSILDSFKIDHEG